MTTPPARTGFIRTGALCCLAGAVIAVLGAIYTAAAPSSVSPNQVSYPYSPTAFRFTEVVWTITHALVLIGVLALARSGLTGSSRPARIGDWMAVAGMALLVPAELGEAFIAHAVDGSTGDNILGGAFGFALAVAGIGFILSGVTTLRAGRWHDLGRFTPLLIGLLVFIVVIPVQAVRPSVFLWPIALWNVAFIGLGWSLLHAAQAPDAVLAPQPSRVAS